MIRFIQSYAAPDSIEESTIFKMVQKHFDGQVVPVPFYDKKVRLLSTRERCEFGFKNCDDANNGDILFGWGTDIVLYSWLKNKIWGGKKKLNFVSQNLIFNPEGMNMKQRVLYWMYRLALKDKSFSVTVNSPVLVNFYAKLFHCDSNKFHVVYDSMSLSETESQMTRTKDIKEPYVFFGGKAFRDVETFVKIVKLLPNVKFKAVILKNMITSEMNGLKNLEVFHDLEASEFYRILNNSSVCCIPLKASIPCGLFVMQHAILMDIPIVATETMSMRTIVPDDNHGFLLPRGDAKGMAEKIELILIDKNIRNKITYHAKENMKNMTPEAVGKQICDVLDNVMRQMKLNNYTS